MLTRAVGNASSLALRQAQIQSQVRCLSATSVAFKDKNVMDQAKQGAEHLVDKAKEALHKAKKMAEDQKLTKKAHETYDHAKESLSNTAKNFGSGSIGTKIEHAKERVQNMVPEGAQETLENIQQKVQHVKTQVLHGGTTPSAKGKSATYDPRGSQEHVDKIIEENRKEFSNFDKKHGGTGADSMKGGFDPRTH